MRRYIIAAAVAVPLIAVLFVSIAYANDELLGEQRIGRSVSAAGFDLSRLTPTTATGLLSTYEAGLLADPLTVIVDGTQLTLDPTEAGFTIDTEAIVSSAMGAHRDDRLISNFNNWVGSFSSNVDLTIPTSVDEEALAELFDEWTRTVIDTPAYEGAIRVVNGQPTAEYPQAGLRIDTEAAVALVHEQLASPNREAVELPLVPLAPVITDADVDAALAEAKGLIGSSIALSADGRPGTIVFTRAGLATAFTSEVVHHSPAVLEVGLSPSRLIEIASRTANQFAVPPIDATVTFDETTRELSIVPSVIGEVVDLDAVPDAVASAIAGNRKGAIPMKDGDEAEFTTEMAENSGPLSEVSSFTTKHPCCQSRVTNIQLLADEVRGAVVLPGHEFSINDHAGQRTLAEGYVRAGAIIAGRVQCCDSSINIGGGTSQFATTFYNAVFFGCYEDVFHQPHSLYFSRYPFVREATLGFPMPDVIFRNDSDAPVYIHTEYTSGSITVTLYGNNGGRTCTSERSGNTITRVMEHPDGSVTTQDWTWNYRKPKPEPTTTTTTKPPVTTTTGAPATTTTVPPTTTTLPPPTTTTIAAPPPTTTTTLPPDP